MLSSLTSPATARSRYRSRRAVRGPPRDVPTHFVTKWTKAKLSLLVVGTCVLAMTTVLPAYLLERSAADSAVKMHPPASLDATMKRSADIENKLRQKFQNAGGVVANRAMDVLRPKRHALSPDELQQPPSHEPPVVRADADQVKQPPTVSAHAAVQDGSPAFRQRLARGVSGLPMSRTPALQGAAPGHIQCDIDVDDIAYWNDPQGKRDRDFVSPFRSPPGSYLTFEADPGGWNNIRMSMEIIFVIAAVTGRTLVLPPKAPFYLLGTGTNNAKSFGNFFPLDNPAFQNKVKVITMSQFLRMEGKNIIGLDDDTMAKLEPVAEMCLHNPNSNLSCDILHTHLRDKGMQPPMEGSKDCFIFDQEYLETGKAPDESIQEAVKRFCGTRTPHFLDKDLQNAPLIHWDASTFKHRILQHFYTFLYFTDPVIDNHYKRFVRDFLHYKDQIFCAAGKIIHALNDDLGRGQWSSMHIRRGDFQYKMVKLPAEEWYNNTKELWQPGETIFIATDDQNRTFFDPIKEHNPIKFLGDYWDIAGLGNLDKNYLGMIDTIVASHGRVFAGTWFSTFTGYINRMRGYLGHSMQNSWYSWLPRKDQMQRWTYPTGNYPAREWPVGWTGIDGDQWIEHELEPVNDDGTENGEEILKEVPAIRNFQNKYKVSDLKGDDGFSSKPPARGVAGLPVDQTPALNSAARAHIECDINVDSLAYWNDPQGERDQQFQSPFKDDASGEKYITFTVDRGGWNNVRMSMEIIFVIAAATGRTLVLPPKEPLYRLRADTKNINRGFSDFFPLHTAEFQKRVKVISIAEFVAREGGPDGVAPIPADMKDKVMASVEHCDKREKSPSSCTHIADYLNAVGYAPDARAKDYCFIFDEDVSNGLEMSDENRAKAKRFCGTRKQAAWGPEFSQHPVVHFRAGDKEYRLLAHFYGFIYFTNPTIGNYYKRFVRDYLHYNDQIYCAAGKIVKALQAEGEERGFEVDDEGAGGYSALHVRRGELQFKRVKIPAEQWYENTKEVWLPNEILYIATDERNKTFFDPIAQHHDVRFLDDYFEMAGLGDLDPNYFGMIDTIISSRGRAFAGTWFSTFTGYINRMRGYHGMSMMDTWYSFLPKKTGSHQWNNVDHFVFAFEWPDGWIGIDGDEEPSRDLF